MSSASSAAVPPATPALPASSSSSAALAPAVACAKLPPEELAGACTAYLRALSLAEAASEPADVERRLDALRSKLGRVLGTKGPHLLAPVPLPPLQVLVEVGAGGRKRARNGAAAAAAAPPPGAGASAAT